MHDSVELEDLGIPTALLYTKMFENSLRFHAEIEGRPDFEAVLVEPVATLGEEGIYAAADDSVGRIVAVLTGSVQGG